ncbi:MAG: hypothetical protein DME19_17830 [Verrucomicrobia bacterium]|nr:MAG: hypothetical protein DME19_17830 [Verrucomicrobiota bacterium]
MLEFLGGDSVENVTCEYLTAGDVSDSHHRQPQQVGSLPGFWEHGWDISRSLWDHNSLVIHLDIEYVNFDFPVEPYLEPERIFDLQRPVELVIEAVLLDYGIVPLHLLSGRGHHFVWRIRQNSRAFRRLSKLGRVPPTLEKLNAQSHRPNGKSVSPRLGGAFAGLGLVMEYLAHRMKEEAAPLCGIPIELTAVEVGSNQHGREMISIDISEYGDPLSTRVVRVPFSLYLKPQQQRNVLGEQIVNRLPPVFLIPLHEMDSQQGVRVMHDINQVTDLARRATVKIPDQTQSTEGLISSYQKSSLKEFHDWFYSQEHEPVEKWTATYDRPSFDPLPNCTRYILEHPNDLLLRPGNIERVVRVMLSLGWHPRHIAGLIRSKFERDYGWDDRWNGYDPATRADFYTRVFAGLFVTGVDSCQRQLRQLRRS